MNILWLSHNVPYPPIGGVLQRSYNLLRELASHHNIYLLAFNQKAILPSKRDIDRAKIELQKLCKYVEILPIPSDSSQLAWYTLVLRSLFTKDPYTVNWLKTRKMHERVQSVIQRVQFHIIHYDTLSLAEYFNATGNIPKVLNHHNIESAMMLRRAANETNIFARKYCQIEGSKLKKYEANICNKYAVNLTVSHLDKDILARTVKNKPIEIIPNGVDINYFRPNSGRIIKNSMIITGTLNWYPNRAATMYFIRKVWPLVRDALPNAQLIIAGKNPTQEMRKIAESEPNIKVTGFVDDIRPHLERAEVYVCPIQDGGGTRLKILDAMAMGKAVVSTSIACEGIDVTPDKNILIADTPEEFFYQIKRVFYNQDLRIALGRHARDLMIEKYSWKVIGSKMREIYETLA